MTVNLYNYTGRTNVANKLISRLHSLVWSGKIVPDGEFTPTGGAFRLSEKYEANYAKYTFNGVLYHAFISVDVLSNGLFLYHVDVDPLATAYYAGCLNSEQYYRYFSDWTGRYTPATVDFGSLVYDNRVTKSALKLIDYIPINEPGHLTERFPLNRIVIGIIEPAAEGNSHVHFDGRNQVENPFISVYVTSTTTGLDFLTKISSDANALRITPQIAFAYAVPGAWINLPAQSPQNAILVYFPDAANHTYESYVYTMPASRTPDIYLYSTRPSSSSIGYQANVDITLDQSNLTATQTLHVQDVGDINFTFSDVLTTSANKITKIGFIIDYDFSDGVAIARLWINDHIYQQYSVKASIPFAIPLIGDGYITDYEYLKTKYLQNTFNSAANLLSQDLGGSIASTVAFGPVGFAVSTALNVIGGLVKNRQQYENAVYEEKRRDSLTPTNVVGNGTNSTDAAIGRVSQFVYTKFRTNQSDVNDLYGKPFLQKYNIYGTSSSHLYGYFQTEGCNLPLNGLPREIIVSANAAVDLGFILAPNSASADPYYT